MQRKTINNEGELRKYQEVCFSAGYHWNSGSTDVWRHEGRYPIRIITRPETMTMTWTTVLQPLSDIAETIGNEAVYLEALEHIHEVLCNTASDINSGAADMRVCTDAFVHICSIVSLALQCTQTGTGEIDRTQEYAESKLSTPIRDMVIGNGQINKAS